jgi:hypothetical protein
VAISACADDPAGASDPEPQFELAADRPETYQPIDLHVDAGPHGSTMMIQHGELVVEGAGGGSTYTFSMMEGTHGFDGTLMFFRPGEHELHFRAMGQGGIIKNLGHHQVTVHRQHRVIGPYWVEFEASPSPVLMEQSAQLRFIVFDLLGDGSPGDAATGLDASLTIHDRAGGESGVSLVELEASVYGADHIFGASGLYEFHLEIDAGGTHESGDLHMPVLASSEDDGLDYMDHHGGRGHGHGG